MHDIFISYAKEDKTPAQHLAKALEAKGFDVWYDIEIPTGTTFDNVIEKALNDTKCVIVLWSEHSIDSEWVKVEAAEGKSRDILVPVLIGDVKIPLAFRRRQTASLADWLNGVENDSFDRLVEDIRLIIPEDQLTNSGETYKENPDEEKKKQITPPPHKPKNGKWVKLAVITGVVVIAIFGWWKISADKNKAEDAIKQNQQLIESNKKKEEAAEANSQALRRSEMVLGNKFEGGIIFYIDETKEHGLIMAQGDQTQAPIFWLVSASNTRVEKAGAYDTNLYDGMANTEKIVAKFGDDVYPAKLCSDLVIDSYTDWYLPSQKELDLLYENRGLGDFTDDYYWSSTEISNVDVYYRSFYTGKSYNKLAKQNNYSIQNKGKVRAIRKF